MEILKLGTKELSAQDELVVFLHGMPGIKSHQNQDLARALNEKFKVNCWVPFYEGLSVSPGQFSFVKNFNDLRDLFSSILSQNKKLKLSFVGHSYGGYLSLHFAHEFKGRISKVFLMSPLLVNFTEDRLTVLTEDIRQTYPELNMPSLSSMISDYRDFISDHPAEDLKDGLHQDAKYMILQSGPDTITPASIARDFVRNEPIKYLEINQDHSFLENRNEVISILENFWKSS